MAPVDNGIRFECPECNEIQSVPRDKIGQEIYCSHCGEQVYVPPPLSTLDKLAVGLLDEEEFDHPGDLKIEGISNEAADTSSWNIRCHICDSVLLVTDSQIGTEVKCNDCYTMLTVGPRKIANLEEGISDGSDLEVVADDLPAPVAAAESVDDSGELTLMPAVELAPEVTELQRETSIEDLVEDEALMELTEEHLDEPAQDPIPLGEPLYVEPQPVSPMFGPPALASEEDQHQEDDSDEDIELLDIPPEELNQPVAPAPQQLPRLPRRGKKQPAAIPVDHDDDAPVRVHAKRRPGKDSPRVPDRSSAAAQLDFENARPAEVLDKAVKVLKSGKIWIWAIVAIILMATGSSIWQWLQPHRMDIDTTPFAKRLLHWGAGLMFGQTPFFIGYVVLLFVGGVIFRETAQGEMKVRSVSATDAADFTSTMLLFGFSMFVAALPCMLFGYMFLSIPVQFLLAGFFLYAAWKNQGAFLIISGSVVSSFSHAAGSWKNWFIVGGIAAAVGVIGGLLMEVYLPIISVFTSIVGAVVVTMATLLYAVVTGWHCGTVVEKMQHAENAASK